MINNQQIEFKGTIVSLCTTENQKHGTSTLSFAANIFKFDVPTRELQQPGEILNTSGVVVTSAYFPSTGTISNSVIYHVQSIMKQRDGDAVNTRSRS